MSSPSSPLTGSPVDGHHSPSSRVTRTVAIIKPHALDHRFEIEQRIYEAGFEIVKERQMEFDVETDPDVLHELFGDDYLSFAEGPVWVYVLERRRAVQVWHALMGDQDPEIAREETSTSLRALYGISKEQNGLMGSPDEEMAEIQILSIFASSPPFPPTDLPDVSDLSLGHSQASKHSSTTSPGRKPRFHARPLPVTHLQPDIVPRMSRAAALRTGVDVESPKRYPATPESIAKTFAGVPGHKRAEAIPVASTAPPAIAPRMTRAASLRLGIQPPSPQATKPRKSLPNPDTFEGVPGHKRRETISVASTRPPAVAPRMNRNATLRTQKDSAPPSSFNARGAPPSSFPRSTSRASLDMGSTSTRPNIQRPASAASVRAAASNQAPSSKPSRPASSHAHPEDGAATPKKPQRRPSIVQSPPSIEPRTNKSALLRAAKMATGAVTAKVSGMKGASSRPIKA